MCKNTLSIFELQNYSVKLVLTTQYKRKICKRLINLNAIKKVIASDDFEQNYNDLNVTIFLIPKIRIYECRTFLQYYVGGHICVSLVIYIFIQAK